MNCCLNPDWNIQGRVGEKVMISLISMELPLRGQIGDFSNWKGKDSTLIW